MNPRRKRLEHLERIAGTSDGYTVYVIHSVEPFDSNELVAVVDIIDGRSVRRDPTDAERAAYESDTSTSGVPS